MNEITGQEISDDIFDLKANTDALDGLLLAMAEGQTDNEAKFLDVLRKAAKQSYSSNMSGQGEADAKAEAEYLDYVASVHHAAAA